MSIPLSEFIERVQNGVEFVVTPFTVKDYNALRQKDLTLQTPIEELYRYRYTLNSVLGGGGWLQVIDGKVVELQQDTFF